MPAAEVSVTKLGACLVRAAYRSSAARAKRQLSKSTRVVIQPTMIVRAIFGEGPLLADCVEEVGGPTDWGVARNKARASFFSVRPALDGAPGSALPSVEGGGCRF